jgi:hypothetical protein
MNNHLMAGMYELRDLPDWLLAPLQSQKVIDSLCRSVREFESGEWSIQRCSIKRFFLKDDSGYWEGTYRLTVKSSATGQEQTVTLYGLLTAPWLVKPTSTERSASPFGSPDWRCFLPELNLSLETEPPEKKLASLAQVTDPSQSRVLLEKVFREEGRLPADRSIVSCTPQILSDKPGSRCIIRYELEYSSPSEPLPRCPRAVIGKVYRNNSKAQNAFEGMSALWHSSLANNSLVTIAEPITYLPDLKMMLQATIPGEASLEDLLKSVIKSPNVENQKTLFDYMRKTAAGLAALHQSRAVYGDHIELEERFAEAHEKAHRLAVIIPELEKHILPLIDQLENLAAVYPEETVVPTHGTFNPEQVLINGERIGFIDFDSQSMAEPALDVGLFRAAIKDTGMNISFPSKFPDQSERLARLALLDEIGDVFLSEYETHAPVSRDRVALWEAIDYLRNCLHYWIKVKPAEPDHALLILDHHLQNCEKNHLLGQSQL